MASAIVRQWLILSMLPQRPRRIDTSAIESRLRARGIDVHRRTIQRDLIELAEAFPIVADERAKPFGWRWSDDATFLGQLPKPKPQEADSTVDVVLRVAKTSLGMLVEVLARVDAVEIVTPIELRRGP